jgi:hypothetical protein
MPISEIVFGVVTIVILPTLGWLINKQLAINKQVDKNTSAIEVLESNFPYIRNRVDAIYDHLLSHAGSYQRRGEKE